MSDRDKEKDTQSAKYTKEKIVRIIRKAYNERGGNDFNTREYNEWKEESDIGDNSEIPRAGTICRVFGKWKKAVDAAGVPYEDRGKKSKDEIIELLEEFPADESVSWNKLRKKLPQDAPDPYTIHKRFDGGINQALDAAGLPQINTNHSKNYGDIEIIEAVELFVHSREKLTQKEYNKFADSNDLPKAGTIYNRTDCSWRELISIASDRKALENRIQREYIEKNLEFFSTVVDQSLSKEQYERFRHECKKSCPSSDEILGLYDTWNKALNAAGSIDEENTYVDPSEELQNSIIDFIEQNWEYTKDSYNSFSEDREDMSPVDEVLNSFESFKTAVVEIAENEDLVLEPQTKNDRYSRIQALEALREVLDKVDDRLTKDVYDEKRTKDQPSSEEITRLFRGWVVAKKIAAPKENSKMCKNKTKHKYNIRHCINAILEVAGKSDNLSVDEFKRKRNPEYHPSDGYIQNLFGSWNGAVSSANLSQNRYRKDNDWDREDAIRSVRRIWNSTDGWIQENDYMEEREIDKYPSLSAINNLFDCWTDLLESARIPNNGKRENGVDTSRDGHNWDDQRKHVLDRDGWECAICGVSQKELKQESKRSLEVHHIIPKNKFESPSVSNHLTNLVTLCPEHHRCSEDKALQYMSLEEQLEYLDRDKNDILVAEDTEKSYSEVQDKFKSYPFEE